MDNEDDSDTKMFEREESALRELAGWEGDSFESEAQCEQAVSKIRAFRSGPGDTVCDDSTDHGLTPKVRSEVDRVGPYQLLGLIGRGGMGRVYQARHEKLGRVVALKVLATASLERSGSTRRFDREMRALGRFNHPNIVSASDAGVRNGIHFLAMEYVDGVSLAQIIGHHGQLDVADACELARQTAIGLAAAHDHGLVHRDIKPSNMMLTRDADGSPRVKILDLGLALARDAEWTEELTSDGQIVGTYDYMAPEQGINSHEVDHRADLFSLGATLARLLCVGAEPEESTGGLSQLTPVQRFLRRVDEDLPSIAAYRSDLPDELVELIDHMLMRLPEDRPATAQEVADRLAPLASGHRLSALLASTPVIQPKSDDDRLTALLSRLNDPPPRTKLPSMFALATLCLLLVGAVAWLLRGDHDRSDRSERMTPAVATDPLEVNAAETPRFDEARWKLASHLIGHWPVHQRDDGVLRDASGHGRDGQCDEMRYSSAAPLDADSRSLNLAGLKQPIVIDCDADSLCVSVWLRGNPPRFDRAPVVQRSHDHGGFALIVRGDQSLVPGRAQLEVTDAEGNLHTVTTSSRVLDRSWHHVVACCDPSSISIYLDGRLQESQSFKRKLELHDAPIRIGSPSDASHLQLDELALFDIAATDSEVRWLTKNRLSPVPVSSPLAAERVAAIRDAWADHLQLPAQWTNSAGIDFCLIPPGRFVMGSSEADLERMMAFDKRKNMRTKYPTEKPQHAVRITRPFYLSRCEITQAQYRAVSGHNPAAFSAEGERASRIADLDSTDQLPVERVSWIEATEFCDQLSRREDLPVAYEVDGDEYRFGPAGYRLPTEAEWEYACRAGTTSDWSYGQSPFGEYEHVVSNSDKRSWPVGELKPNPLGLHDMHGNVFEWCFDYFTPEGYDVDPDVDVTSDPTGPADGVRRVFRGGSWWQRRPNSRSAFRGSHFPHFKHDEHGFRVLLPIEAR